MEGQKRKQRDERENVELLLLVIGCACALYSIFLVK